MKDRIRLTDAEGAQAVLEGNLRDHAGTVAVRLGDGTRCHLPAALLQQQANGSYYVNVPFRELTRPASAEQKLLEAEEHLHVGKTIRETGRLRVQQHVETTTEVVDEPLMRETVHVTHVPVGTYVDSPQPIRHEGDTVVVPVYEEVLVVEKRLLLREEVRITRHRDETRDPQEVTLRRTRVETERLPATPEA